jgi:methyl-accepting chemotaxis protein
MPSQRSSDSSLSKAVLAEAVERSIGLVEFKPDGTIVRANDLFLAVLGYTQAEIEGCHHSMLLAPEDVADSQYQEFWALLASGKTHAGQIRRIRKDGSTVWLEASYNPVLDSQGQTVAVVKIASDITQPKELAMANAARMAAIERAMTVIELTTDGNIIETNQLFLDLTGYSQEEVNGQPYGQFIRSGGSASSADAAFWESLASGQISRGQSELIGKDGRSIWLESTYNPILDISGHTVRIVQYATDITEKFEAAHQMAEKARELELAVAKAREAERVREELDRTLQEMSTPVTPIWDEILLLPLVGVVDSTRTDDVMRKTLSRISETRSKVFILDISGVPTVDTAVANQLIKITRATRLMGCETIISGLSPAIAHTMVDLGVDVGMVRTTATLRDAFKMSLRQVGTLQGLGSDRAHERKGSS